MVQGERICGWSCDPASPYYKEDHHMCPAECRGNFYIPNPKRKRKVERIDDVCSTAAPALPAVVGKASCAGDAAQLTAAGVWMLIGVQTGPVLLLLQDRTSCCSLSRIEPGGLCAFAAGCFRYGGITTPLLLLDRTTPLSLRHRISRGASARPVRVLLPPAVC